MKPIQTVVIISLFLLMCFVPAANASENIPSTGYYPYALPAYGEVTQGEVDYHVYRVPHGASFLEVSLIWDIDQGNSLSLSIHPPSGSPFVYSDSIDGIFDGKISLRTPLPLQMTGEDWCFDVTGLSVNGVQSYTLIINV